MVVDRGGFAAAGSVMTDLTRAITGTVASRLSARRSGLAPRNMIASLGDVNVAAAADLPPPRRTSGMWVAGFGGFDGPPDDDRPGPDGCPLTDGQGADAQHIYGGTVMGYDAELSPDTIAGVFAGLSKSDVQVWHNAYDNQLDGYFGGAYLSHQAGPVFLDLTALAGLVEHDQDRVLVNNLVSGGLETASASYDGVMVSPSLTVGLNHALPMATLTPSVRVRYTGLFLDGYTETGSAANLTVGDRDVHALELRGQLAFTLAAQHVASGVWQTRLMGGADGIFTWGDDVTGTLRGQGIRFAAIGDDRVVRGFGGVEAVFTSFGGTQFFTSAEAGRDSTGTNSADARLGFVVPF
jgi:uncharacterized protein with beta-barrel porin domain